jgi:PmbA protein
LEEWLALGEKVLGKTGRTETYDAEIFFIRNTTTTIHFDHKRIANQLQVTDGGAAIRIVLNGQLGHTFTTHVTEEELTRQIQTAEALAQSSPPIDGLALPEPQPFPDVTGLFDQAIASMSLEELFDRATSLRNEMITSPHIRLRDTYSTVQTTLEKIGILNTKGVSGSFTRTGFSISLVAFARKGDRVGSWAAVSEHKCDISIDPEALAEEVKEKALNGLEPSSVSTFDGPVIFENRAFIRPFGQILLESTQADTIHQGQSFLQDKLGEAISDHGFTLANDGLQPLFPNSAPFDAEGVPTQRVSMIENGIFRRILYNTQFANRDGEKSTGNAIRDSYKSPITIGGHNLFVSPGSHSREQLIQEIQKGIFVGRFSGNVQVENGDFSGAAKQAYLIEDGELTASLEGVMISGNVFDAIKQISGIANNPKQNFGFTAPDIRVEGIKVIGSE